MNTDDFEEVTVMEEALEQIQAILDDPYPQPDQWFKPMTYLLLSVNEQLSALNQGLASIDKGVDLIREQTTRPEPVDEEPHPVQDGSI